MDAAITFVAWAEAVFPMPIRASMYLLALINTNLGQGGVAYYLHRKAGISFLGALSSILFIALLEIYQLFLFSTLGVIFYAPASPAQMRIVGILRIAYIVAWMLLASIIIFFSIARRSPGIRNWVETGRAGDWPAHDLLAIWSLVDPDVFGWETLPVSVDVGGSAAWGATVVDRRLARYEAWAGEDPERRKTNRRVATMLREHSGVMERERNDRLKR